MIKIYNCGLNLLAASVQSGRAIQHVKDNIFTAEGGVRRGIPNVLVVLTDGRSQDDVNKISKEMQMEGEDVSQRSERDQLVWSLIHDSTVIVFS